MKLNPSMIAARGGRGICGAGGTRKGSGRLSVSHWALEKALKDAVKEANGGLSLNMWGTIVTGKAMSVPSRSRAPTTSRSGWEPCNSAQKANTANAFNLGPNSNAAGQSGSRRRSGAATANLYSAFSRAARLRPAAQQSGATPQRLRWRAEDFETVVIAVGKRVGGVTSSAVASVFTMPSTPLSRCRVSGERRVRITRSHGESANNLVSITSRGQRVSAMQRAQITSSTILSVAKCRRFSPTVPLHGGSDAAAGRSTMTTHDSLQLRLARHRRSRLNCACN